MINRFRALNPVNILLLAVLLVVLRISLIFKVHPDVHYTLTEPFASFLTPGFFESLISPALNAIIAAVFVLVQGLWLNHIVNQYNLTGKPTFLPALIYITLSGVFNSLLVLGQPLICSFLMILLTGKLLSLYKSGKGIATAYDLGMIIGIGTLIYFPFIYLILAIWVGFIIFRQFNWREWAVVLMGFITIFFFLGVYYYLNDQISVFLHIWQPLANLVPSQIRFSNSDYLLLTPVAIITLSAFYLLRKNFFKSYVQVRKSFQLLIVMAIISSVSYYFNASYSIDHSMLCLAPTAVIFAYYFATAKYAWFYETLYLALVSSIVYLQFNTF